MMIIFRMILIQLLMAIEEQLDKPIIDYFDWVSGTSTGGILALCLAKRMSRTAKTLNHPH